MPQGRPSPEPRTSRAKPTTWPGVALWLEKPSSRLGSTRSEPERRRPAHVRVDEEPPHRIRPGWPRPRSQAGSRTRRSGRPPQAAPARPPAPAPAIIAAARVAVAVEPGCVTDVVHPRLFSARTLPSGSTTLTSSRHQSVSRGHLEVAHRNSKRNLRGPPAEFGTTLNGLAGFGEGKFTSG